jgi:CMP-N,N'-diacetyllegionaminic acid synthase
VSLRVLGLVPARGGSARVPRKNLATIGGVTLVRRALQTALDARCFACVALTSDDDEILAQAQGLDVVGIRRPSALATSKARAFDVVVHAVRELDPHGGRFDAIAVVQCTSPFTAPGDLAGAVALLERSGADSVVSVARIDSAIHPGKLKVLEGDRLLPYLEDDRLAPSHELPPLWARNGSIYVSLVKTLEQGEVVAGDIRGYEMPVERSFDIDTPRDLALAGLLVERAACADPAPFSDS